MEAYPKYAESTDVFTAFRVEGYPTFYDENRRSAWIDVWFVELCALFLGLYVAFLIIIPGYEGAMKLYILARTTVGLLVGFLILMCQFLPYWQFGKQIVLIHYESDNPFGLMSAEIGLRIGLGGINITINGDRNESTEWPKLILNEHFSWEWEQGKKGFGIQAGTFNRQFMQAKQKGLPEVVLEIAEHFTVDEGSLRFGRILKQRGYFTRMVLWFALIMWLLSVILINMIVQYGALMLSACGLGLLTANCVFLSLSPDLPLCMPFEGVDGQTVFLKPRLSILFYINLANGLTCLMIGIITLIIDLRLPNGSSDFFGISFLQTYDDIYSEIDDSTIRHAETLKSETHSNIDHHRTVEMRPLPQPQMGLRRRTVLSNRLSRLQVNPYKSLSSSAAKQPNNYQLQEVVENEPLDVEKGYTSAQSLTDNPSSFYMQSKSPESPVYSVPGPQLRLVREEQQVQESKVVPGRRLVLPTSPFIEELRKEQSHRVSPQNK